jgi:hypothetical protein
MDISKCQDRPSRSHDLAFPAYLLHFTLLTHLFSAFTVYSTLSCPSREELSDEFDKLLNPDSPFKLPIEDKKNLILHQQRKLQCQVATLLPFLTHVAANSANLPKKIQILIRSISAMSPQKDVLNNGIKRCIAITAITAFKLPIP